MEGPVFDFEFLSEVNVPVDEPRAEAESRLRKLADGHTDMIGASVAVERVAHGETPHVYQVRIVAYIRPENIVAVQKADTVEVAMRNALTAVERQVRDSRDMLRERWKRP